MKLSNLVQLLNATIYTENIYDKDMDLNYSFSCDLMSDALVILKKAPKKFCQEAILSTGLVTLQGIKTAEMLGINCLLIVRGKTPTNQVISVAEKLNINIIGTEYTMFSSNGRMYDAGIKGISEFEDLSRALV